LKKILGKDLIRNSSKKLSLKSELKNEIKSKDSQPSPTPVDQEKREEVK
jgi:hypothetical protein